MDAFDVEVCALRLPGGPTLVGLPLAPQMPLLARMTEQLLGEGACVQRVGGFVGACARCQQPGELSTPLARDRGGHLGPVGLHLLGGGCAQGVIVGAHQNLDAGKGGPRYWTE